MPDPQIIMGWGSSERERNFARDNLTSHTYQDTSTIIVMPAVGDIPARVTDCFRSLMAPPNTKTTHLIVSNLEVGTAYETAIDIIFGHPDLATWRYMFTFEQDNLVPPHALLKLQRGMIEGGYDVLGGLYFTKGEDGVAQIWGDRSEPLNFRPQLPQYDTIVDCWGTGLGCTLIDLDVFRKKMEKVPRPWFQTLSGIEGQGQYTQDLRFFSQAYEHGVELKVGIDCSLDIGHLDVKTGVVW